MNSLYKLYKEEFINYVDGLMKHNVKLSDLRLKQICKKWDIYIEDTSNGYMTQAEWDDVLQQKIIDLVSLKK